jgi:hypothetical protein
LVATAGLAACFGYGWLWLRLLRTADRTDPLHVPYALALGMGTLGYLILAAGLLGGLTRPVLALLSVVGWALAVAGLRSWRKAAPGTDAEKPEGVTTALWGLVALLAAITAISALRVPDGWDWDGLSYHLAAPKIYLRAGRIVFIPYDSHTDFPFTLEMLFTYGLAFGGTGAAKLFHWAAGWLTAVSVGLWTRRLSANGRPVPRWAGAVAALAFGSMPLVLWEIGTAYIDLGTACFQFLALAALLDGIRFQAGRPALDARQLVLAGVFTGFALGTKYTALIQFGLLGLGLCWVLVRASPEGRAKTWVAAALFLVASLAVASPWYVKNWIWVHNPVYPFFYRFFPHSYSWNAEAERGYSGEQDQFGFGTAPAAVLSVFWNLAVHGRAFFIKAPKTLLGDKLGSLGPLWAGLLPLVFWARRLDWRSVACLAYSLASIGIWLLMTQQTRYLLPVFAPLAVFVGVLLAGLDSRLVRRAALGFVGLTTLMSVGMHLPMAQTALRVVSGQISERDYLHVVLPGLYDAAEFINSQLPPGSKVALYQETRGFYLDRDYFWGNPGQHNEIPYDQLKSTDDLVAALRRLGITHVLINYEFSRDQGEAPWYRLLMGAIRTGRLEEIYRSEGAELERKGVMVYVIR